ncbi:MAG: hypothetical protein Q8P67_27560 [archaeon]|nr:hypothetical protein [archaeon]
MQRNPFVSDGQGRERPIDELFDEESVDAVELHVLSQRRRANSLLSTVTTLLPPSSSPPPAHDQAPSRLLDDEEDGRGSSPSDVVSLLHDGDDDHHSSGSQFDGKLSFSEAWRLIGRSLKLALVVCAVLLIASLLGFFVLFFSSQPGSCVNVSNNATHLSNTTDSPPPIPLPDLAPGYFDNDLFVSFLPFIILIPSPANLFFFLLIPPHL